MPGSRPPSSLFSSSPDGFHCTLQSGRKRSKAIAVPFVRIVGLIFIKIVRYKDLRSISPLTLPSDEG